MSTQHCKDPAQVWKSVFPTAQHDPVELVQFCLFDFSKDDVIGGRAKETTISLATPKHVGLSHLTAKQSAPPDKM